MNTVIPAWSLPGAEVAGSDSRFPVRRIYCVGRNYADHAREMNTDPTVDPTREPPFFFSKPADALAAGGDVPYPPLTANLQHEVELVVALARGGADIPVEAARDCIFGYAVGLDLTRRDIQARAKEKGQPWDMAKGFDHSAPVGAIVPVAQSGHPLQGSITLAVNGATRQAGDLAQMSWSVAEIIARLSQYVRLAPGDLIFTGTPAGVSTVVRGDRLEGRIEGVGTLAIRLV